jgi:hypothetical protein
MEAFQLPEGMTRRTEQLRTPLTQYPGVLAQLLLQADPPVCNPCKTRITRKNFGWSYVEKEDDTGQQFEWVECTACILTDFPPSILVHIVD